MKNKKFSEMRLILSILKSPEEHHNANNLAKLLKMSSMGVLKITKRLEKEGILVSKKVGRANILKINLESDYVVQYIKFLLKKEAQNASPYVRRWINELKKLKSPLAVILYGSVLEKENKAGDVDSLIIVDKKGFEKTKKEVEELNSLNDKEIHPLYQTFKDLRKHIKEENNIVLDAIKGVVVFGEEEFLKILKNESFKK